MACITLEQREKIGQFSCERLSCRTENRELLEHFENKKGPGLINNLKHNAWNEDISGAVAHYLIKFPDGEAALYFSLKCGSLFLPLDEEQLKEQVEYLKKLMQGISRDGSKHEDTLSMLEILRSGLDVSLDEIKKSVNRIGQKASEILIALETDKMREQNEQIMRVRHTYPAIDFVNFCSNDLVKDRWKALGLGHPMGEVMFWQYIVPIIIDIQKYIGCQYVFLFAADISDDQTLINYYNVALNFERKSDVGTNKPFYDFCCEFMCQEIKCLGERRDSFFANFNRDDDVV